MQGLSKRLHRWVFDEPKTSAKGVSRLILCTMIAGGGISGLTILAETRFWFVSAFILTIAVIAWIIWTLMPEHKTSKKEV